MRQRAKDVMASKGYIEIDVQAWTELNKRLSTVEANQQQIMNNHLKHIKDEVSWIKERLERGYRPPWSVITILTFLSSVCVGLIVHAIF